MSAFAPKDYQARVLESVEKYFVACHATGDADTAFYATTRELWEQGQKFHPLPGFAVDMPYFCLRVPTGGGKTFLAASAVAVRLLRPAGAGCSEAVPAKMTPSGNRCSLGSVAP